MRIDSCHRRLGYAVRVGMLVVILAAPCAGAQERAPFRGMDESVNETLAAEAGRPSHDPLIDTESFGELWNLLLLCGGAVCGFILGRHWDQIWGRKNPGSENDGS